MSQANIASSIMNAPFDDPAKLIPGLAPNFGQFAVPQVMTVQGLASSLARTYRPSDEALRASWADARNMQLDVGICECIEARMRSVALLDWSLQPEDEKSPLQKELCTQLTGIIKRIPRFMQFRENLARATWFGRYAVQSRYQWRNVNGAMRCLPTATLPIHGDKLVFSIDNPDSVGIRIGLGTPLKRGDNVNGYRVLDISEIEGCGYPTVMTEQSLAYMLTPDRRRLLCIHKHQIEDGAFEDPIEAGKINGVGIRSKVYWEWYQKQAILGFLIEYLERSALGIEIWYYPANNAQAEAKVKESVKARISNGHNVLFVPRPLGEEQAYGVEHIEPGMGGVQALQELIEKYFARRIKRYILGQTLTTESEGGGLGSDGIANVHLGTFMDIVKYDATNLEETLTTDLVDVLKLYNFPGSANTHIRFVIETETPDADKKLQAVKTAWEMGARVREQDVFDAASLSPPNADDRILPGPNGAQSDEQQQDQRTKFAEELAARLRDRGMVDDRTTANLPGLPEPKPESGKETPNVMAA